MAPLFDYKALTAAGKSQKGIIEAESQKAARAKIKKQGLMVTDIQERSGASSGKALKEGSFSLFNRIKHEDIALVTRQLASLVKANIPLVDALGAIVDQCEQPRLKIVLAQVRQDVNEGLSLGKAAASHPRVFDTIFLNMIEAGESSGTLSAVLIRLADLKEAQMRLRNKVVSGMTYPLIMLVVATGLMMGIFTVVIPKLTRIFESMKKPIPLLTQAIMSFSDFLVTSWYMIILAIIGCVILFQRYTATSEGRAQWDAIKLKLPVIGPLVRTVAAARFASTMATLLSSGVPILTSMLIAKNLVDNVHIARAIENARENITEGQSIAEPLRRSGQFPPMMIHMISIGEKTGELPAMLQNVASIYEDQVTNQIDAMTSLLEPVMIIGMGLGVGFIVMAVFMPLMEMMNINKR